ncbi:hypothetical protein Tco_0764434 [Tanacetum coccineum]
MEQDIVAAEDDDFGDLYADVELEASSAINIAPQINSVLDVIEDNDIDEDDDDDDDDDSEDDLDIVLNSDGDGDSVRPGGDVLRNNAGLRSNEEEDNVAADSVYYKYLRYQSTAHGSDLKGYGSVAAAYMSMGGQLELGNILDDEYRHTGHISSGTTASEPAQLVEDYPFLDQWSISTVSVPRAFPFMKDG